MMLLLIIKVSEPVVVLYFGLLIVFKVVIQTSNLKSMHGKNSGPKQSGQLHNFELDISR
jgi:hypothetical protein